MGQRRVAAQDRQGLLAALKAGGAEPVQDGRHRLKQEDQIITVMMEKNAGKKMTYVPFKGGGDVAVQLVGKHIDSTVNNPIEAGRTGAPASCARCA